MLPYFFSPHLFIITVKTKCHLQLLNSGRSLLRCSSFDFGQKGTKFQMRQKPNTCAQDSKGSEMDGEEFLATTSESSLNLTNLITADHDAVEYPCKRVVPAICSLQHNDSYRDFHSHQDLWSCTLSPHSVWYRGYADPMTESPLIPRLLMSVRVTTATHARRFLVRRRES